MKKILFLLLLVSGVASAQYLPTGAKTRFVNGIGFGTKSEASLGVQDSLVLFAAADSTLMFKYKGTAKALAYASSLTGFVPYTGATTNLNLGSFKITANKAQLDSLQAKGSGGLGFYSNSGTKVGEFGVGGGSNFDFHGFAGYNVNRSVNYTNRSFTDKRYVDSIAGLKVNFTDTATMLSPYARNYSVVKYTDTSTMLSPYQRSYNAVTLTGIQTITGAKTFSSILTASSRVNINGAVDNSNYALNVNGTMSSLQGQDFKSDHVDNLFIGLYAGQSNTRLSSTQGANNTFIGASAGRFNTTGYARTDIGFGAGYNNTIGNGNANFGYQSGFSNISGNYNTNVGTDAGSRNKGSNNSFFGWHSGFGFSAFLTGDDNNIVGAETAINMLAAFGNNGFGKRVFYNLTNGYNNAAFGDLNSFTLTTGINNAAFGRDAMFSNSTGQDNTFIGNRSGYYATSSYNTAIGSTALFGVTTGASNTGVGLGAGLSITTGSNNTILGTNVDIGNVSNHILIGNGTGAVKAKHDGTNWTFTGAATFSSLAGTGTRMVVASSTGELSTQAIAGGTDGTYTPTLTNVSNTSSLTGNNVTYTKVGSTYHISMLATITATTVGTCQFTISIPSTINNATQRSNGLAIGLNGEVGTLVYNSTTSLICKFVSLFASVPTTLSVEFDYSEN